MQGNEILKLTGHHVLLYQHLHQSPYLESDKFWK